MPLANLPNRLCTQLLTTSLSSLSQTSLPYSKPALSITSILLRQGLLTSLTLGTPTHPDPTQFPTLPTATKRIWVTMKYRNGQPVLKKLRLVSKPSLRVVVTRDELGRLLMGKTSRNIGGVGIGEILVVKVKKVKKDGKEEERAVGEENYLEGWEAWRAGLGGEIVCRAG